MKIYTKTGDKGETSLFGGEGVPKNNLRVDAYGNLDELNASLGLVIACLKENDTFESKVLQNIQSQLFQLGAELADPKKSAKNVILLDDSHLTFLENTIDQIEEKLKPLSHFILPGGSLPSAHCHLARTICRRAERSVLHLHQKEPQRPEVLMYLNRLSDFLFVLARKFNHDLNQDESLWINH